MTTPSVTSLPYQAIYQMKELGVTDPVGFSFSFSFKHLVGNGKSKSLSLISVKSVIIFCNITITIITYK